MDTELNRKLGLKHFFESMGYGLLKEELDNLQECFQADAQRMLGEPVNPQELGTFNFNLGQIAGLNRVLLILQSMKDELENDSAQDKA